MLFSSRYLILQSFSFNRIDIDEDDARGHPDLVGQDDTDVTTSGTDEERAAMKAASEALFLDSSQSEITFVHFCSGAALRKLVNSWRTQPPCSACQKFALGDESEAAQPHADITFRRNKGGLIFCSKQALNEIFLPLHHFLTANRKKFSNSSEKRLVQAILAEFLKATPRVGPGCHPDLLLSSVRKFILTRLYYWRLEKPPQVKPAVMSSRSHYSAAMK